MSFPRAIALLIPILGMIYPLAATTDPETEGVVWLADEDFPRGGKAAISYRPAGDAFLLKGHIGDALYNSSNGQLLYGDLADQNFSGILDYSTAGSRVAIRSSPLSLDVLSASSGDLLQSFAAQPGLEIRARFFADGQKICLWDEALGLKAYSVESGVALIDLQARRQTGLVPKGAATFPFAFSDDSTQLQMVATLLSTIFWKDALRFATWQRDPSPARRNTRHSFRP